MDVPQNFYNNINYSQRDIKPFKMAFENMTGEFWQGNGYD